MSELIDVIKQRIAHEAKYLIKTAGNEKELTDRVIILFEKIYKLEQQNKMLEEEIKRLKNDMMEIEMGEHL